MTTDPSTGNRGRKAALILVAVGLAAIFVGSLVYRMENPGMQKQVQSHVHATENGQPAGGMDMDAVREMIDALEARLAENPADLEALFQLAEIELMRQDRDRALAYLDQARGQAGEDTAALHRLSSMYFQLERNEDAAAVLRRILEIDPNEGYASYNLGVLLRYRMGDDQAAAEAFRAVLGMEGFDDLKEQSQKELEAMGMGETGHGNP